MNEKQERAEMLAALHAAGAASEDDEKELATLLADDPELEKIVRDFEDSIAALATSFDPMETPPRTLGQIQKKIAKEKGGLLSRLRSVFSKD
jgi:anti-sigma-K factor RskA